MFKILDLYLFKKHLVTYFFVVLLIISIICIIDYTEQNDDFLKNNVPLIEILRDYYLNLIPYYANLLSPLMIFIATVFITAKLASHTEIIAILSSGISFFRFLVPYLVSATLIALLTFYFNGWAIPKANKKRFAFELTYLRNTQRFSDRDVHIKTAPNEYIYMQSFDNNLKNGYKFTLERIENNRIVSKLFTNKISWDTTKTCWHIDRYKLQHFRGDSQELIFGRDLDTVLSITPNDFKTFAGIVESLTLDELSSYIDEQRSRGADNLEEYLVNYHERYTYPFAIIILTVIGVILSARKSRQGIGVQIALGFTLAFIYILFVVLSRNLALVGDMSPVAAAWTPTVLFTFIGMSLYKYIPK